MQTSVVTLELLVFLKNSPVLRDAKSTCRYASEEASVCIPLVCDWTINAFHVNREIYKIF